MDRRENGEQVSIAFDRVVTALGDRVDSRHDGRIESRCPAHEDRKASLSVKVGDKGVVLHCHTGCATERIVQAIGLTMADLFDVPLPAPLKFKTPAKRGRGTLYPSSNTATAQHAQGCTLAAYASAKKLPIEKLKTFGLTDIGYNSVPAVRIPYRGIDGTDGPVRFRLALEKGDGADPRFAWKKGSKPTPYGLERLDDAKRLKYIVLLEGESDCHTLWCQQFPIPALGIPGAASYRQEWSKYFEDIETIYVVVEPDRGGEAVLAWLAKSSIRDRVRLVWFTDHKDVSELHVADPDQFNTRWALALKESEPWSDYADRDAQDKTSTAWLQCASLACQPDILRDLDDSLDERGVVGERRASRLVYLAATSRCLDRPVSIVIKGPSAGGKSHIVQQVLDHFPADAFYALSAMSERALAYSEEPLKHRMLVIYEAAGMSGDFATYLIRSLLSEGCVRYETVEKTKDGLRPRLIEREGPTGLITTTTAVTLHPENETRLLSIPVTDTPDQTKQILRALSADQHEPGDLSAWRALQSWLAMRDCRVVVPYAMALADLIPPVAIRLRRDFRTLLTLIKAHAALHQVNRDRDATGRIIATLSDYDVIRELVLDLFDVAVQGSVRQIVRDTVIAVASLNGPSMEPVSLGAVAKRLDLDKGTVSRRVREALADGYLQNLETRKNQPHKLIVGDNMPESMPLLPKSADLMSCCSVARVAGGVNLAPPPSTRTDELTNLIIERGAL